MSKIMDTIPKFARPPPLHDPWPHWGNPYQEQLKDFLQLPQTHPLWGPSSSTLTQGLLGQFLIKRIRRSKFFTPRWHWWKLVRILTIENTLYVSIWLPCMLQTTLAKYARVGNCPSCFDHQRIGFWTKSNGTSNVWKQDNSHWTRITYIISKLVTCAKCKHKQKINFNSQTSLKIWK